MVYYEDHTTHDERILKVIILFEYNLTHQGSDLVFKDICKYECGTHITSVGGIMQISMVQMYTNLFIGAKRLWLSGYE